MEESDAAKDLEFEDLVRRIREFVAERDWEQFHSPKNLAMALIVEAAELVEIFQWMTEEESQQLDEARLKHVEEEVADVMNYLIRLSDRVGIDLLEAMDRKLIINEKKYPADLVHGNSSKYSEYQH